MEDVDPEQQEPFPVDRDGKPFRAGVDRPDGDRKVGCCDRFQESISRWMLPEDARSKYLERANCFPPPIFIILISIAEVDPSQVLGFILPPHGFRCSPWDVRSRHLHFHRGSSSGRARIPPVPAGAQPSVFLSCAQLSVFIYYAVWKPQKQWVTLDEGIWNSPLTYQPDQRKEAWRFISYMFVHAG